MVTGDRHHLVGLQQFATHVDRTDAVSDVARRNHEFDTSRLERAECRCEPLVFGMNVPNYSYSLQSHGHLNLVAQPYL